MCAKQKTVKDNIIIEGIGLHTADQVKLILRPAEPDTGIVFIRVDLEGHPAIKADPTNIHANMGMARCTTIGSGDVIINTVEHLMSVLCGLEITNIVIDVDAAELPGLDGSGLEFLQAIQAVGIEEQDKDSKFFEIKEAIGVECDGSSIMVFPSDDFKISYTLDYDHSLLRSQYVHFNMTQGTFESDIAPCRTFCLQNESEDLKSNGLGKGANYNNTLVVGETGVVENQLRFEDEFARHKILDLIGDLYLFGIPLKGHIVAVKSGHVLNFELLKKIYKQKKYYTENQVVVSYDTTDQEVIPIESIMKILPHRYPFLLVDKVIKVEVGKKAIGIKNVTINDDFFRGHFPTKPIMPGVLMIEAMAQTAGVVILTNETHHGKVAFFMAVDNVKFRKVVTPGDQLVMEVEVIKDKSRFAKVKGVAKVDGNIVAEADMMFSFTDMSYLSD